MKNNGRILIGLSLIVGATVFSFVQLLKSIEADSIRTIGLLSFALGVFAGIAMCLLYVTLVSKPESKVAVGQVLQAGVNVIGIFFPFYSLFLLSVSKNLWVYIGGIFVVAAWMLLHTRFRNTDGGERKGRG